MCFVFLWMIYLLMTVAYWSYLLLLHLDLCPFMSNHVCFMKMDTVMFVAYKFIIIISSWWVVPYIYILNFFISSDLFWLEVYFLRYEYISYLAFSFYLLSIWFLIFSLSVGEMCLFQTTNSWILWFNRTCQSVSFNYRVKIIYILLLTGVCWFL
jgi:hypothetical protein